MENNYDSNTIELPLVSIIVPVYNVELYLKKCVDSIISQTYHNIEVILVDDGSCDNSGSICDEYAIIDRRIIVIHKENGGQSLARNSALEVANGEYIAFIDSDDYVATDFIEKLYHRIVDDQSDIAVCDYYEINEDNSINDKTYELQDSVIDEREFWLMECQNHYMFCVALWNKLFKKSIWKELRFKYGKYAEDNFAMTRYIPGKRISILNEKMYYYLQRQNSSVHDYNIKNLDRVEADLERCLYFVSNDMKYIAKKTLFWCIHSLLRGFNQLDFSVSLNRNRFFELRNNYKRVYRKVFNKVELDDLWFKCTVFYFSIKVYMKLMKIKSKHK